MTLIKDAERLSLPHLSFLSPLHFSVSCIYPSSLPSLSLSSLFIHTSIIHLQREVALLSPGGRRLRIGLKLYSAPEVVTASRRSSDVDVALG